MKITNVILFLIIFFSCNYKSPKEDLKELSSLKDTPTPIDKKTLEKSNEVLAPQTCYYGCKARR